MPSLSAESLFLAGFTLAHATWSVSDTTADELLCPLAVIEEGDERRLLRFEDESQAGAIDAGRAAMEEHRQAGISYAFAREGQWRPDGPDSAPEDILTVDFWAPGMTEPQVLLQPFTRASTNAAFRVAASPLLVLDGRAIAQEDAQGALDIVLQGIESHPEVTSLWATWRSREAEDA